MNYHLVCERCSHRLEKKGVETTCPLSQELVKAMRKEYLAEHGHKCPTRTVLTACLGSCPANSVCYLQLRDNQAPQEKTYPGHASRSDIKKLFFS